MPKIFQCLRMPKTFDCVHHDNLVRKLRHYGMTWTFLNLI